MSRLVGTTRAVGSGSGSSGKGAASGFERGPKMSSRKGRAVLGLWAGHTAPRGDQQGGVWGQVWGEGATAGRLPAAAKQKQWVPGHAAGLRGDSTR